MSRNIVLSEAIRQGQRRAADPAASIWVAANAGSGKTHVLTERVLRLLLSGVKPESILCLTYTKAAAAEMRERVARRLAEWALADDADLAERIAEVEGRAAKPAELMRARTLFAHALETPGGLKIVTIHAFCESVLHRFPLEAGVPVDFTVVEEADRADMVQEARDSVLAEGLKGAPLVADAVAVLFERLSDFAITEAIDVALADSRKLKPLLGAHSTAGTLLQGLGESSPYLWELASGDATRLLRLLTCDPDAHLAALLAKSAAAVAATEDEAEAMRLLRRMKAEAALLIALADIGGVWPVMRATRALTDGGSSLVLVSISTSDHL